jgi:hypothetical protein
MFDRLVDFHAYERFSLLDHSELLPGKVKAAA